MKTKLIAILLIATLLLSSAPMVLAEDNNETTEDTAVRGKKPLLRKAVPVVKQYRTDKATYQRLRENYVERKEAFEEKKEELEQLRERLRAASAGDKDALRAQVKEKAIENIITYIQKAISRMDALKERGAESEKIDTLIEDLQGYLVELEDTENLTRERVVEIAKDVRTKARYMHYKGKHVVLKSLINRLSAYADKTEKAYERLSEVISELKDEGKDVTRLETALATLKTDIDRIEEALTKAETEPVTTKVEKVAKAVHERLKKDILLIRKMIRHYKGLKKGQEVTEELTVESTDDLEEAIEDLDSQEPTGEDLEEVEDIEETGEQ